MNDFIIKNNKFKPFEIFNSNTWPNSSGIFCLLNNQECIFLGRTVKNDNSYIKFIIKPGPSQSTFQGVHDYITIHKNKLSFYWKAIVNKDDIKEELKQLLKEYKPKIRKRKVR